jgi:RNA polymerase sigma factor (sigma-70 family)
MVREDIEVDSVPLPEPREDLIALDEALERLAALDTKKAELVKLRYFAGLTMEEAAEALGVSLSLAEKYWTYAKAWLYREMRGKNSDR